MNTREDNSLTNRETRTLQLNRYERRYIQSLCRNDFEAYRPRRLRHMMRVLKVKLRRFLDK